MMKKWISVTLLVLWTGWIFWNSAQSATSSTELSDRVMELFGFSFSAFWVRKAAHFLQFALWGCLMSAVLYCFGVKGRAAVGYLLFACLAVAAVDETIQLFPIGRSSELRDVWIDFFGGTGGIGIFYLMTKYRCKYRRSRV